MEKFELYNKSQYEMKYKYINIIRQKHLPARTRPHLLFFLFVQLINLYNDPMQGLIRHLMQFKPVDIL